LWRRRQQLALAVNCAVMTAALGVAALTSGTDAWEPLELLATLAVFAIASELFSVSIRRNATPQDGRTGCAFTSTAPYVLAVVLLGAAPALAIAAVSLAIASILERPAWRDAVANFAQYSVDVVSTALLAEVLIGALDISPGDVGLILLVVVLYAFFLSVSVLYNACHGAVAYGESIRAAKSLEGRTELVVEAPMILTTALTAYVYETDGLVALAALVPLQLTFIALARELRRSYEHGAALSRRGTELARLHRELARHAGRISYLSVSRSRLADRVMAAEEAERRRLADALHDEAMQNLLVARQDLSSDASVATLERARQALDATIDQLREAIFELHPAVLARLGLPAAIEALAGRAARRGGFEVHVEVSTTSGESARDLLLFTVVRELLSNAAEHSGASRVDVEISEQPGRVCLEVRDDGCGFARERLRCALEEGHVGLASTEERIVALGGQFQVESAPGDGSLFRVTIPFHAAPVAAQDQTDGLNGHPVPVAGSAD
jgi:signal transduction histidine kinase